MIKKILKYHLNKISYITLFAALLLSCATVPHKVKFFGYSHRIIDYYNKKVVVLPFTNLSGKSIATPIVTDDFSLALIKLNLFDVVERYRLNELFKEQDNYFTGNRIDINTARKMGKILGADAVFIGTIKRFDEGVSGYGLLKSPPAIELSVKMLDINTGMNIWGAEDAFSGNDKSVQLLVPAQDKNRVSNDVNFLSRLICRELVKTMIASTITKKNTANSSQTSNSQTANKSDTGVSNSISVRVENNSFNNIDIIKSSGTLLKNNKNKTSIMINLDKLVPYQKTTLLDSGIILLNNIAQFILDNKVEKTVIEIYTDDVPIKSSKIFNNTDYSIDVGNVIKKYFVSKGIKDDNIAVIGFGESHPLVTNYSDYTRMKNRRIVIKVFK